jgi:hypothetical protein
MEWLQYSSQSRASTPLSLCSFTDVLAATDAFAVPCCVIVGGDVAPAAAVSVSACVFVFVVLLLSLLLFLVLRSLFY